MILKRHETYSIIKIVFFVFSIVVQLKQNKMLILQGLRVARVAVTKRWPLIENNTAYQAFSWGVAISKVTLNH